MGSLDGKVAVVTGAAGWLCTPAASFVLRVALPLDRGSVVP
jgi:hypothetical protein